MNLDVYNTHMELYPYKKHDLPALELLFTSIDNFSKEEMPCGYMITEKKLYLPRGTPISKVEYMSGCKVNYMNESDPIEKMSETFESLYEPRNKLQEDAIKFLTEESNHQLSFNILMGEGKTFCTAYASTKLNDKTIVIVPNEGLKTQWIDTYHKMFSYHPRNLMNIAGSKIIDGIMDDSIEPRDVYFVNHATLRNYMTEHGGYALHKFFKKLGVGIKVYDESHLDFHNIIMIDHFTNTNRTWYLTATFDRSDKTESVCFKRAFANTLNFGEVESLQKLQKHVVYHVVNFNSRPTIQQRRQVMGWRGMTATSYGKYAFITDTKQVAYHIILRILELIKDVEGKVLIFIPLIEAVDIVVEKLRKEIHDRSVAAYHSKIGKEEKESAIKKDIIVTTIKSCGTGRDIPGLRSVINMEPLASSVGSFQLIGRIRRWSDGRDTYFFDCVDVSIAACNWWFRSRYKKIETLVKKTIYLNLDE